MTDFDYIPIETTEGHRPPSPASDRLLIGLAAVALSGGLLIAAGNLFGDDGVSLASGSPSPSAQPSRTPRPTASPRPRLELDLQPAVLPSPSQEPSLFSGWIRASTDLVVRSAARADATELGILAEGAIAQADEWTEAPDDGMGWLHINTPQPQGWVATLDGGTLLAERYSQSWGAWSSSIWAVAAGDDGFLAIGTDAGRSDEVSRPVAMVSADGARWRAFEGPPEWATGWTPTIAWGPAGWLSAVVVDDGRGLPIVWFSQSPDGPDWGSLGVLDSLRSDAWMVQLVASERGYLLSTSGQRSSFWFSVDGITWRESEESGLGRESSVRAVATSIGFYAWEEDSWRGPASEAAEAVFSVDGRTWSSVEGGPVGTARQIASVGDRLVGLDIDPVTGEARAWVGLRARSTVVWLRDTDGEASFRDAVPSSLISDGERAVAFGWDRATEEALVWTLGPDGWARSRLPGAFEGIPRQAAGGPAGLVVVGAQPNMRGQNPIIWHQAASGSWAPEASPILPVVPDPAPEECGAPPRDALEYTVLDRFVAVVCLGDEPITFRAWAADCEGCYGAGEGTYEEAWLQGVTGEQLYLSPVRDDTGGWWSPAIVHPSLEYDASWPRNWLEVTGHFDDPAASNCRYVPSPSELWWYEGRQTTVNQCRQQFVVTQVSVVSGP